MISPIENIDLIRNYFFSKPVKKAFLFGSSSRGESSAESDVDILVELDYSKPIGLEFVQMQLDLQDLLNKKVDLITLNSLSRHIKPFVDKEKVLIYERFEG
ncbi:nucleotidyltransferase domain-containing protein [Candidatus Dojkabacteria bacterium]|nr:nucleotidyltransferase domain-containing protein [Candidatus Dojkabacteria bacterium]